VVFAESCNALWLYLVTVSAIHQKIGQLTTISCAAGLIALKSVGFIDKAQGEYE
jgi:hypothetical protein